jgi:hypothetical protein
MKPLRLFAFVYRWGRERCCWGRVRSVVGAVEYLWIAAGPSPAVALALGLALGAALSLPAWWVASQNAEAAASATRTAARAVELGERAAASLDDCADLAEVQRARVETCSRLAP